MLFLIKIFICQIIFSLYIYKIHWTNNLQKSIHYADFYIRMMLDVLNMIIVHACAITIYVFYFMDILLNWWGFVCATERDNDSNWLSHIRKFTRVWPDKV